LLDTLSRYYFPGNIRELKNLVERIVILGKEPTERELLAWLDPAHCCGFQTSFQNPETQGNLAKRTIPLLLKPLICKFWKGVPSACPGTSPGGSFQSGPVAGDYSTGFGSTP